MLPEEDPFEEFKRHRSIELLESTFKGKAREKRERLKKLLHEYGSGPGLENKVEEEMKNFFDDSKRIAETIFSHFDEREEGGEKASGKKIEELFKESEESTREILNTLRGGEEGDSRQMQEALDQILERPLQSLQSYHESRSKAGKGISQEAVEGKSDLNAKSEEEDRAVTPQTTEQTPASRETRFSIRPNINEKKENVSLLDRLIFTSKKIDALLDILLEKKIISKKDLAEKMKDA